MVEHPKAFRFHKAYANIPLPERSEICSVVNNEPLSWRAVKSEIDHKTKAGYGAIEQLLKLEII